jgi:polyphosphate kinase
MRYLFKHFITGQYDHLFVDKTVGTPFSLRKNIYEIIEEEESDSD